MSGAVLYEERGPVAVVTINRPDQANAINADVRDGLRGAFERFERDETALVAILTGSGARAFSAGADLKEMAAMNLRVPPPDFIPQIDRNLTVTKPVIAAVNGIAVGGGFLLAQTCDLCVAAEHAEFGITEARWGRGAPWAVPLLHMVPQRIMMEVLLTAETIGARRAYEVGLVNRVVPADALLETAVGLAERIAAMAPLTVRAHKQVVRLAAEMERSAALEAADALFESVYESEDAQEGPRAFREKREPVWKGR